MGISWNLDVPKSPASKYVVFNSLLLDWPVSMCVAESFNVISTNIKMSELKHLYACQGPTTIQMKPFRGSKIGVQLKPWGRELVFG